MTEILDFISQNLMEVLSLLGIGTGGGLLYWRQEKQSKVISNASATNLEWQRLSEEKAREIDRLNEKLYDVFADLNEERRQHTADVDAERTLRLKAEERTAQLKAKVGYYHGAYCKKFTCQERDPSLEQLVKMTDISEIMQ